MKKGRFLWSAHRITEKQKAGKARNIKEKQLKNLRNTASRPLVAHLSSPSAKLRVQVAQKLRKTSVFRGFSCLCHRLRVAAADAAEQRNIIILRKALLTNKKDAL